MRLYARLRRIERAAGERRAVNVRMAEHSLQRTVFTLAQMQSAYKLYFPESLNQTPVRPTNCNTLADSVQV